VILFGKEDWFTIVGLVGMLVFLVFIFLGDYWGSKNDDGPDGCTF